MRQKNGRTEMLGFQATLAEKARIDRAARAMQLNRTEMIHRIFRDWGAFYERETIGDDQPAGADSAHAARHADRK